MARELYSDTLGIIELWSRVRSQHCATTKAFSPKAILQHFDTMEQMQQKCRITTQNNGRLSEMNDRLKRQIGNYVTELDDSKTTIHQLVSDLAASKARNECLQAELEEHRRIFELANDELKNVTLRKSTLQKESECFVIDKSVQDGNNRHRNGEKSRSKRRSSSHHQILSGKRSKLAFNDIKHNDERARFARQPADLADDAHLPFSIAFCGAKNSPHIGPTVLSCREETPKNAKYGRTARTACASGSRLPLRLARRRADAGRPAAPPPPSLPVMRRRRSISEPSLCRSKIPAVAVADAKQINTPTFRRCNGSRTPQSSGRKLLGFGVGWTRGRPIHSCDHQFAEEHALGKFLQNCKMCENRLGLSYYKCKDCKLCVHFNCHFLAPLPCVPFVVPSASTKVDGLGQKFRLADYCHPTIPKVPAQLIRCVYAIESDQNNGVEVYEHMERAWSDPSILALFDDFEKARAATVLNGLRAYTLAGFIKSFLQGLKEPLIPISSYNEFLLAAQLKDDDLLRKAIDDLFPLPNRDTLAYLCLHWQQMIKCSQQAEYANANQADQDIVGLLWHDDLPSKQHEQIVIMEQLLNFGNWAQILVKCSAPDDVPKSKGHLAEASVGIQKPEMNNISTPFGGLSADSSMLGPVTWTPLTPFEAQEQRSKLVSQMKRKGPLFDRPY
uniref:Phorbol-ester/DAG-type domain-containing protein n=1 Tax=Globodera pallida TaxID=36090 RepID=A0A183C0J3_GLOPA